MNRGDTLKSCLKYLALAILALVIAVGAFSMGYLTHSLWPGEQEQAAVIEIEVEPETPAPPQILVTDEDVPADMDVFWEAWSYVEQQFYGELPSDQERVYGAIRGMVNSFADPHTAFIDPERAAIFREDSTGSFEGIGATVRMDEMGRLSIAEPYAGRPAAKAGLLPGDIILEVDGTSLQAMNLYEAISLIRGPAGSTVVLNVFREGENEPFDVSVVRERIEIEVVESERLGGDIGYVSLSDFSRGASVKVADAIEELEEDGELKGLILDLRNNPGGLLDEAIFVANEFIGEGVITVEREKGGKEHVFEAQPGGAALEVPLVVLVNQGSASASEIVAGAIQENERGTVLGKTSFGKGSVQIPHELSDGSELRVTTAEWLTPELRQINKEGISPDIEVDMTMEDYEAERDPQQDAALEYLLGEE